MSDHPVDAVRGAVRALNSGDFDGYLSAFAPTCLRTVPGMPEPLQLSEIGDNLRALGVAFDGFRLDPAVLFGDGRYVCARWIMTGTHTGEYFGIPATDRAISVETWEVYEFDDGEVVASWAFGDPLELVRQLGALPDAEAKS
jgi:predicted ester cyclase